MKKSKLLILMLFACMVLSSMTAVKSNAEETEGEQLTSGQENENSQCDESITAMDENGNITEVGDSDGVVEEENNSRARSASPMVVNFNTKENATTSYTEDGTGKSGYVNGDYGADAAYLGTSNGKVKFMMSGVVGWVDESEVQVVSIDSVQVISGYEVDNGRLLHCIVYDMTTPGYRSRLDNGEAPSYLTSGQKYYSYDGHYFYEDYATMISDYQNNTRSNSVNPNQPYYNYYQYLPLRSQTTYSGDDLNNMIASKASGSSKMSNTGSDFVNAQNTYGVNALLMVSIAGNESAWGTSTIANAKNNIFGLNAVDSSPGASADTFSSIQNCIQNFASGWMSKIYLNPSNSTYFGGFLGNKGSGINVKYASDPYWGEKAANIAYNLDKSAGSQDAEKYTIGIKDTLTSDHNTVNVRQEGSTSSTVLYQTSSSASYAVLILDSSAAGGFYRIQSDAALNGDRSAVSSSSEYSFDSMYAYISSDYITIVNLGASSSETGGTTGTEGGTTGTEGGTTGTEGGTTGTEGDTTGTEGDTTGTEGGTTGTEGSTTGTEEDTTGAESATEDNTITDTVTDKSDDSYLQAVPKTGDDSTVGIWVVLASAAVIIIVVSIVLKKLKK